MPQQTIKFTIRQDGTVTEEVMGVVGNDCENLTKRIEERLGVVERVEHKSEYYWYSNCRYSILSTGTNHITKRCPYC